MTRPAALLVALACALSPLSCSSPQTAASAAAAKLGFERLAALEGDWVGAGPPDTPGPMTVNYRVTGGGSAVVETLFVGTPDEMVTVFAVEDGELVLTHYCSLGNQPRMRAQPMQGDVLDFHFIGGANIDPAIDMHLHDARFEFVSNDELITQWTGWSGGRPDAEHAASLHFRRRG